MRFCTLMFALLVPWPAFALSCLPPSVERSYAQAAAAAEDYVVVHGRLTLDMDMLPRSRLSDQQPPEMTWINGALVGKSLSQSGFKVPFDHKITLEVACLGPWCGSAQNGEDILAFVRKDGADYALEINPCGGNVSGAPKRKMLKTVATCMREGVCSAQ
jgi:hypothetical protein